MLYRLNQLLGWPLAAYTADPLVDTGNGLPGRHVVIPPQWIKSVDWTERVVNVGVMRDVVEAAPEYHSDPDFSPAYAAALCRHYHRPAGGRPAR